MPDDRHIVGRHRQDGRNDFDQCSKQWARRRIARVEQWLAVQIADLDHETFRGHSQSEVSAQAVVRDRDAARADAEEARRELGEAQSAIEELRAARTDDAKLRAEAAEALDAAIGELKTLSGGRADG